MSYEIIIGNDVPVRVKDFLDVRDVFAEAITNLTREDPEGAVRGAMEVNEAITSGAAEHSVVAHGSWATTVTVAGRDVVFSVARKRWWQ